MAKRLKLTTPQDCRKALNKIANLLLNEQIEPKIANAIIYCCNVTLQSIRTDEIERRIAALEESVNQNI